ncbi:MAG: BatA domain-containing protein [Gemmatimonas sp.]
MIWQNLWALTGLSLLALPVLIHMLSRKRAVLQKFPTLRFLNVTRLLPTRSPNLTDIPLLLVRLATVAAAVFALAQPLWLSASRKQSLNASLARVIVVDTSRSMRGVLANGTSALDSARALATTLATDASTSVVLQTASPSNVLAGAGAWLNTQGGRGDVVLVSDFQAGAVDSAALAGVPQQFGVRAIRLGTVPTTNSGIFLHTARTNVTATADSARIGAEWTLASGVASSVVLLSALGDRAVVDAARDAANVVTSPSAPDTSKLVAIVFPGAAEVATLTQAAKVPSAPWMGEALVDVRENEMLSSSAASETLTDTVIGSPFAIVARSRTGAPVVYAAQSTVNGGNRLVFFQRGSASALSSAALIAAVSTSIGVASDIPESETSALSDDALRRLERTARAVGAGSSASDQRATTRSGLSDGRWLWIVVLLLLGVETWMRRKVRDNSLLEVA